MILYLVREHYIRNIIRIHIHAIQLLYSFEEYHRNYHE